MIWVLGAVAVFMFVYATNIGQVVHKTPNPTWWERIGRRAK